jgi:hypothetical protein
MKRDTPTSGLCWCQGRNMKTLPITVAARSKMWVLIAGTLESWVRNSLVHCIGCRFSCEVSCDSETFQPNESAAVIRETVNILIWVSAADFLCVGHKSQAFYTNLSWSVIQKKVFWDVISPQKHYSGSGFLLDRKPKQCWALAEEKRDEIGALLERWPRMSLKRLVQVTGVSVGALRTATKFLKLRRYKTTLVHCL